MSDAEETLLEETEESGETEMEEEEEYNPNYKEVQNMQQEPKDDDILAWRGSQEEEGEEREKEEWEEKEKEEGDEEGEEKEKEEGDEEGEEKEDKEEEEEEEEEEAVIEETEEKAGEAQEEAAGAQEETTVKPQEINKSMINLEKFIDSQSTMPETFPITHTRSESKHSLQAESSSETNELSEGLSSQHEFLDLDQISTEEQQISSPEKQSSGELEENIDQMPQDELGQERRDLVPEKGVERQEKRVSYFHNEGEGKQFQSKQGICKESLLSTTTEDILFQKDENADVYPLTMTWLYGWNSSLPVYYIRDENQRVLLYVCAHTAVLYNVFRNNQHHLQGHPNIISCVCISEDRRWIATADKGPDCLIIIWDSFTGIPVHTIFDSCPEGNGIRAIAMSPDAKYLATISDAEVQKVCIWKWTLAVETPASTLELPKEYGLQNYLTFNPTNNKELVSNSRTQTIYYLWKRISEQISSRYTNTRQNHEIKKTLKVKQNLPPDSAIPRSFFSSDYFYCTYQNEERGILAHSAPLLTEKTFNKLVGKFSQSVFHLNLTQILSATMEGKLVVWDIHRPPLSSATFLGFPYIKPCKLVHLQKEGITVLTTVDSYIVTGDIKGNIKFYDHTLSIVNWYSHFKLNSIRTLSFSKTPATLTEKSNFPPDCTLKGDLFIVRNLVIGTSDATVYHLTTDGTKLEKLFKEPKDAICAISCHPYQSLIAIGSVCGMIKVWDYEKKIYLFSRVFEKGLGVQSLTYNPEGALLGAGFTEGTVYILDAMSLESEIPEPFKYSRTSVTHISFSHDSQYMATAIEYNLRKSHKDHLEVLDIHRTDQGSYPTCMVWYPPLTKELFLLICNSSYKVKLFNSTTKMCRQTLVGPAYGSPIEQTQVLPVKTTVELQKRYLVFINRDKIGLQILPVDGNPHKTSAIVCHPNGVAGMTLSYDGCYAFTAGGHDCLVVQWKINLRALEAAVSLGGEDLTPFYGLVSGGREGKFYRELEDYFYYSQLRSQGIGTMETRKVSEHICLSELPFVMRAIGFYPSEEEVMMVVAQSPGHLLVPEKKALIKMIDDMFNEIKFSEYMDTGKLIDKINLPGLFKVYLNHRPPFGNIMSGIQQSFGVLGFTNSKGKKAIRREDFLKLLLTKGEHMTEEEMTDCFATLYGLNPEGWKSEPATSSVKGSEICLEEELPEEVTAEIFMTEILGLTISENSGGHGP